MNFFANLFQKNTTTNQVAMGVFETGLKMGVFCIDKKEINVLPLANAIFKNHGLALQNDRRKILAPDAYGRIKDSQRRQWQWHLLSVTNSCELPVDYEHTRSVIKNLVLLTGEFKLNSRDIKTEEDLSWHRDVKFNANSIEEYAKLDNENEYLWDSEESMRPHLDRLKAMISTAFEDIIKNEDGLTFDQNMSGLDYEEYCAEILRKLGWKVIVLPASGDHGADLLAQINSLKIAIQCKKYSKSLGNSAVQEIVAAKVHYQTDYAVVITNSTYTKGAQTLAKSNNVMLLHHENLADLASMLGI